MVLHTPHHGNIPPHHGIVMFCLFVGSGITTMALFANHILPMSLGFLHVLSPIVLLSTYGLIVKCCKCSSEPGGGQRIDMTQTGMGNPATAPLGFSSNTSRSISVPNMNTVPLSYAPIPSAPTEVPWHPTPTDTSDMPPPPAYGS